MVAHIVDLLPQTLPNPERFFSQLYHDRKKDDGLGFLPSAARKIAALVFLEPSTRTRLSFEMALKRLGSQSVVLSGKEGSSQEKGESAWDTILNIVAMQPDLLILRVGDDVAVDQLVPQLPCPVLCAGWGKRAHPTQALLDVATLWEEWGTLQGKKILFVGDAKHSRVLASHRQLLPRLGAQLGYYTPQGLGPDLLTHQETVFYNAVEALNWCDAVMGLRLQKERLASQEIRPEHYKNFTLHLSDLTELKDSPLLLHPGPVGWGMEFDRDLVEYPRNLILRQVELGVWVRAYLIKQLWERGSFFG